jgi:hypothetical protein
LYIREGDLNPNIINFHVKETNQYYWAIRLLPTYFLFTYNLIKLEQVKLVCQSRRKFDQRIYAGGSCRLLAAGGKLQYSTCVPHHACLSYTTLESTYTAPDPTFYLTWGWCVKSQNTHSSTNMYPFAAEAWNRWRIEDKPVMNF